MQIESLKFKGNGCFVADWAGFTNVRPINVIIGRNNTGKSQLLELVRISCEGIQQVSSWDFLCSGTLDEQSLRGSFLENYSDSEMGGNHWHNHGQYFVGAPVEWEILKGGSVQNFRIKSGYSHPDGFQSRIELTKPRLSRLYQAVSRASTPLQDKIFRHLLADRDIRPEPPTRDLTLTPDGSGATNIIRRLITSADPKIPRELVQIELRNALNKIFGSDGTFNEIQVQQHDSDGGADSPWEVFLGEERKGLIALSKSGSGLKTVILVLLHLLVIPKISSKSSSDYVFAFEELENNLHPALLRRLLQYIEEFATENKANIFLTTHSSTALDLFGTSPNAQIIHVTHDGSAASASTVEAHFSKLGVISELGAKPSDLLQANGIVWVEGPSDAIYLNKWIDIESNGSFREGRDYLCAFYGGALLARAQFASPEHALDELVNLFLVNPNVIVVCDSDRKSPGSKLKPRVSRIKTELEKIQGALTWVTNPKEIENYIPGEIITSALDLAKPARNPEQYESFFPAKGKTDSYCEKVLGRTSIDKVELATLCSGVTKKGDLDSRFDWPSRMAAIIKTIQRWNN